MPESNLSDLQLLEAKAGSIAEEVIGSIRTVTAFGGQSFEITRYTSNLNDAKRFGIKIGFHIALSLGLVMCVIFHSYALTFWFGAWLIENNITNNIIGQSWKSSEVIIVFFAVLKLLYETIKPDLEIKVS